MENIVKIKKPTLSLSWDRKYWILGTEITDDKKVCSRDDDYGYLELRIVHAWDGQKWNNYRYFEHRHGVEREYISEDEWNERFVAIQDQEGDDAAKKWVDEGNVTIMCYPVDNVFDQLRERYEAVTNTLEVFSVGINM